MPYSKPCFRQFVSEVENLRRFLAFMLPPLVLACDKDKREKSETDDTSPTHDTGPAPDPDPDCDTGLLDDDGACVPATCGTGTWGDLETDEGTVYVDIAAAEGGDGSEAAPFTSIQAALDAAGDADGGMVAVAAGTYPETLELDRGHDDIHLAGRCKELVVVDASVGNESTPGIRFDIRSSMVEMSGLTVSGSRYVGILVGSGTVDIRDFAVAESGYVGVGTYQSGSYATTLTMEACEVGGATIVGVAAMHSGTSLTLRETTIQDTKPDENGQGGFGIQISQGASLDAEACVVKGNTVVGLLADDDSTSVTLRETVIEDTQPDEDAQSGFGIQVYGGARFDAEACVVRGNTAAGLTAYDSGTSITLRDTVIEDTKPDESGENGQGISVYEGANLDAESCDVRGNTVVGVVAADSGTSVALRETNIEDTQPNQNGQGGQGISVYDGASLDAEACEVRGNTALGVVVAGSGTSASLLGTSVEDTRPQENGEGGQGIYAYAGASLDAEACEVRGNTAVGVHAADSGTSVRLWERILENTPANEKGEGGHGIDAHDGASLEAEACEVRRNTVTGVFAYGSGTSVTLEGTIIEDTQPNDGGIDGHGVLVTTGASLHAEGCELRRNTATGVLVAYPSSSVTLRETIIEDTRSSDHSTDGVGIGVMQAASLDAEACDLRGNVGLGLGAVDSGTSVTLRETSVEDTKSDDYGVFGYGIQISEGASLHAEGCEFNGNTALGVLAEGDGTSVTLQDTRIASTKRGEIYTVGVGVAAQDEASVVATGIEVSWNEGPGIAATKDGTQLTCSDCAVRDNQFAGAVVVSDATLDVIQSVIEGTTEQENIGGGVGVYAEPCGGPPFLSVTGTSIQDNAIAGVWLSGGGSYSLTDNAIRGGEGWTRESLTKCGDAVYAGQGVTAWDGVSGLLLENNELRDGLGAGLFLDNASATLSGNSYTDNVVDLVTQGEDCGTPPDGYDGEAFSSEVELCPAYDYATCWDGFRLFLSLAEPESGHGARFMRPGLPGPAAPRLPGPPARLHHAEELSPLLSPSPAPGAPSALPSTAPARATAVSLSL